MNTPESNTVPSSNYIPGLDGMRTFSVFLVILGHAGFAAIPSALGVTIFFFISGFLITNLLMAEYAKTGTINVKDFYVRRYLRLMPEQAFYVAVALVIGMFIGAVPHIINTLGALFYFTNYIKIFQWGQGALPFTTGHFWSLAVEEHFYLTWPLAMLAFLPSYKRVLIFIGVVLIACLAWRVFVVTQGLLPEHYVYYASEARFDSIAYGCLCAVLFRQYPAFIERVARNGVWLLAAGCLLLLIPSTWRTFFGLNETFQEAGRYAVQGAGFILCFTYLYRSPKGALQTLIMRVLELPFMRFAGRASYGAYIWHYCLINTFVMAIGAQSPETMTTANKVICAALAVPASILLGHLSLRFILGPFAALRSRFGSHPKAFPKLQSAATRA